MLICSLTSSKDIPNPEYISCPLLMEITPPLPISPELELILVRKGEGDCSPPFFCPYTSFTQLVIAFSDSIQYLLAVSIMLTKPILI